MSKKVICVEFDGVIHSEVSGWHGADVAKDPPVEGAISWLATTHLNGYQLAIHSSRSYEPGGVECMQEYLRSYGLPFDILTEIQFPRKKPPAYLFVEARTFRFEGTFPNTTFIERFRSWNHR